MHEQVSAGAVGDCLLGGVAQERGARQVCLSLQPDLVEVLSKV